MDNINQAKIITFPILTLIGEAEKGDLCTGVFCSSLWQLWDTFGEPPRETEGLFYAIQSLSFGKPVLFFRVEEEGFSLAEYEVCLESLDKAIPYSDPLGALFLPKVGTQEVIEHSLHICEEHAGILIMNDMDFFDYLSA